MSTAAEEDPALTARKKTTRAEVKAALKALTSEEMASQSAAIATHLLAQLSCFDPDAARTRSATDRPLRLGLYVHCARLREVDTSALLAAALALPRAEVYVPVVDAPDPAAGRRAPPSMRFLQIRSLADLAPRTMGILEPTDRTPDGAPRPNLETHATDGPLDVLLMPGLAFESTGARLGRGGGFYDAFLERYARACDENGWARPPAVALAFDAQVLASGQVPVGSADRNVDALVTAAAALHDVRGPRRNSPAGSVYVVKPKMHGPDECGLAADLFALVERVLWLPEGTVKLSSPDPYRFGLETAAACVAEYEELLTSAEAKPPAAFIVESLICCGGQIVLPEGYLGTMHALTRRHGGVAIADEVQTGFGRVGSHMCAPGMALGPSACRSSSARAC